MESLRLFDINDTEIPLIKGFPEGKKFAQYRMAAATSYYHARIDQDNTMLFIHFDFGEISIWISYYLLTGDAQYYCSGTSECVEHHNTLYGKSQYRLLGFDWRRIKAGQNNLIFLPEIANEVKFSGQLMTFDIHISKGLLYRLGVQYEELQPLIEQVKKGNAGSLYEEFGFISPKSYYIIVLLMDCCDTDEVDQEKVKAMAVQLIKNHILVRGRVETKYRFDYEDIYAIHEVALSLDRNMDREDILSKLIGKTPMNSGKLAEGFKILFDCTPKRFLYQKRMERAKVLLFKNYTLSEICVQTGYSRVSHLENAFLRYFGKSIGEFRKLNDL